MEGEPSNGFDGPSLTQEFKTVEDAFNLYNSFAAKCIFSVRKDYINKSKITGIITSAKFVCAKEGYRGFDKRYKDTTKPRAQTRCGCGAHLKINRDKKFDKYVVIQLKFEHNHPLHSEECAHMMRLQRQILEMQSIQIDIAAYAGISLKGAHDLAGKLSGGIEHLGYTKLHHKNLLRMRRQNQMVAGELGCLLTYFQEKSLQDPRFRYVQQLDCEDQVTNIFGVDSRMQEDCSFFGDVICFDATFNTNRELRPYGAFTDFNHHRQMVVFGVTLLYDESMASFEWLFKTFVEVHSKKKSKTIFTDEDATMGGAIANKLPEVSYCLCSYHIMQNAVKNLAPVVGEVGPILRMFGKCMHELDDEDAFMNKWEEMIRTYELCENSCLSGKFLQHRKWAKCYLNRLLTLGITSIQLSESFNSYVKAYLRRDFNFRDFFIHFERIIIDKRHNELQDEYEARQKLPRILMHAPMILQAAKIYIPYVFELFQKEFEKFLRTIVLTVETVDGLTRYTVVEYGKEISHTVRMISDVETTTCSWGLFVRYTIMCSHMIKVLDSLNYKEIPDAFIVRRWTKHVRDIILERVDNIPNESDERLCVIQRYRRLCTNLVKLANAASESEEGTSLMENALAQLSTQLQSLRVGNNEGNDKAVKVNNVATNSFLTKAKGVKKKEGVKGRQKRRKKSWVEKALEKSKNARSVKHRSEGQSSQIHENMRQQDQPQPIVGS